MQRMGLVLMLAVFVAPAPPAAAQYGAKNGEWRTYGGDLVCAGDL